MDGKENIFETEKVMKTLLIKNACDAVKVLLGRQFIASE